MTIAYQLRNSVAAIGLLFAFAITNANGQQAKPEPAKNDAAGQPARQQDSISEPYVLKTYEVGDLIINVQDHPYTDQLLRTPTKSPNVGGESGGGNGGGMFSVPVGQDHQTQRRSTIASRSAPIRLAQFGGGGGMGGGGGAARQSPPGASTASVSMDDLVRVVVGTVASSSWEVNGGEGRVEPFGTTLIVYQTPIIQSMVADLLDQIRAPAGRRLTMTVDARWLMLTSDDLDALLVKDSSGVPEADRKALAEFTRRGSSIRGMISCFSGQLVFLRSGANRNVVSGWIPVVGATESNDSAGSLVALSGKPQFRFIAETSSPKAEGHVGYQPITGTSNLGSLLEIRPTLIGDSNWAIAEVRSSLTAPAENSMPTGGNAAASTLALAPSIDRVAVETLELATTLRMRLGKPVVVGGMTHMPGSAKAADEAAKSERPQLYLVLEIR